MEGLSGVEESLYIQCLFKTISFYNVREELKKRKMYNGQESYYVMALKLRLALLSEASCSKQVRDELSAEIAGLVVKVLPGFYCSVNGCKFTTKDYYNKLIKHIKTHHGSGSLKLICQLNGCSRELSSLKMLQMHLKSGHRTRKSTVAIRQNQLAEQMLQLKCPSVSCGHQLFKTLTDLKRHLVRGHTEERKEEVKCLFAGCEFVSNKTGTVKSHFTRKHSTLHSLD